MFNTCFSWVLTTLNTLFFHFRGIFLILDIDIIAYIIAGYGVLCVIRLINNGRASFGSVFNIPRETSIRSDSSWSRSGDVDGDISKR